MLDATAKQTLDCIQADFEAKLTLDADSVLPISSLAPQTAFVPQDTVSTSLSVDFLATLPNELVKAIISFLNAKDLFSFGQTCKRYTYFAQSVQQTSAPFGIVVHNPKDTFLHNTVSLYTCGRNDNGQLGLGANTSAKETRFVAVPGLSGKIQKIYTLGDGSFVQMQDGRLFVTGRNTDGELGLGHCDPITDFKEVSGISGQIQRIYAGYRTVFLQMQDGRVFATGCNNVGQLGLGHFENQTRFTEIPGLQAGVVAIHIIDSSVWIQMKDGRLLAAGDNNKGQLGLGPDRPCKQSHFVEVPHLNGEVEACYPLSRDGILIQLQDGRLLAAGCNEKGLLGLGHRHPQNQFVEIPHLKGQIAAIHSFPQAVLIHMQAGSVWAVGENDDGQLGLGEVKQQTCFVLVPGLESGVIKLHRIGQDALWVEMEDGRILAAGRNIEGQLGLGHCKNQSTLVEVPGLKRSDIKIIHTTLKDACLTVQLQDGRVLVAGYNKYGQLGLDHCHNQNSLIEVPGLDGHNIAAIYRGIYSVWLQLQDGQILVAGNHSKGQLGLGADHPAEQTRFVPVPDLKGHITALETNGNSVWLQLNHGQVLAAGNNARGELGLGYSMSRNRLVKVPGIQGEITAIHIIRNYKYENVSNWIQMKDGRVLVAGYNKHGELGLGHCKNQSTFVEVPGVRGKINTIHGLYKASLLHMQDGRVLVAGSDTTIGRFIVDHKRTFLEISQLPNPIKRLWVDYNSVWTQLNDGSIWAIGWRFLREIGIGHCREGFVAEPSLKHGVVDIHIQSKSVWVHMNDGRVLVAGNNDYGQLGLGQFQRQDHFVEVPGLQVKVVKLHLIRNAVFFQMEDGRLLAVGLNSSGKLGLDRELNHQKINQVTEVPGVDSRQIAAFHGHHDSVWIQLKDGRVLVAGSNEHGQLGLGHFNDSDRFTEIPGLKGKVMAIYSNGHSNYAFLQMEDGRVLSAGFNGTGQLGLGHCKTQNRFIEVPSVTGEIVAIHLIREPDHGDATWIHLKDGRLLVAGDNSEGQLGLGHNKHVLHFVEVPFKSRYSFYSPFAARIRQVLDLFAETLNKKNQQDNLKMELHILQALASGYANSKIENEQLSSDFVETTIETVKQTQQWKNKEVAIDFMYSGQTGSLLQELGLFKKPILLSQPVSDSDKTLQACTTKTQSREKKQDAVYQNKI